MLTLDQLYDAASLVKERMPGILEQIREDPEFLARGGIVYPFDILGANLDVIVELLRKSNNEALLTGDGVRHIADVGCANGDITYTLASTGFAVTAVDWSYRHDQAPYIVSTIAKSFDLPVAVCDISVDQAFTIPDLRSACIFDSTNALPLGLSNFDLCICVGLLYHLKNPYAFLESLSRISKYCILGSWTFTHIDPGPISLIEQPLAYLLSTGELGGDPTNFWILSDTAIQRLAVRCGFEVIDKMLLYNDAGLIGYPNQIDKGVRGFYLLRSTVAS